MCRMEAAGVNTCAVTQPADPCLYVLIGSQMDVALDADGVCYDDTAFAAFAALPLR